MLTFNNAAILELLDQALGVDDFEDLCAGHFRKVGRQFTEGQSRSARIRILTEFVTRHRATSALLFEVRRINRARYIEFERRLIHQDPLAMSEPTQVAGDALGAGPVVSSLCPLLGRLVVEDIDVNAAFVRSVPRFSDAVLPDAHLSVADQGLQLCEAVEQLAPLTRQHADKVFPLLRFVHLLRLQIQHRNPELASALSSWLSDSSQRLSGVDFVGAPDLGTAGTPVRPGSSCRLILHLEEMGKAGFFLKAWIRGTQLDSCLVEGATLGQLDDVRAKLEQFRMDLATRGVARDQTELELFLSGGLLMTDIDQWLLNDFGLAMPIGCHYPFVLRSLERASCPIARNLLRSRWDSLKAHDECQVVEEFTASVQQAALFLREDRHELRSLRARLRRAPSLVCALLGFSVNVNHSEPSIFTVLFAEGVPAVMWIREHPIQGSEVSATELIDLVQGQPLQRLAARVFNRRLDAFEREDEAKWHPGSHLSLLFDDPAKPHPDFEDESLLVAPQ